MAVLPLAGLLAACGDDGGGSDDSGSGVGDRPSQAEMQDAAVEYAQCMRDNGIEMEDPEVTEDGGMSIEGGPGPGGGPGPNDDEDFQAADEECQPIMEEVMGEREEPSPEEVAERQDQAVELAQCMRDRGYDFEDPQVSEDGGIMIGSSEAEGSEGNPAPGDPDFEEFNTDFEECHEEAGMELPGEGGGEGGLNSVED